jgi:hypothetical protein
MNEQDRKRSDPRYALNLTIIGVFGQVGFLTLLIVSVALVGGLWLDKVLQTKPMFTIILMAASVPLSLVVMYKVVMWATSRIKPLENNESPIPQEDADRD